MKTNIKLKSKFVVADPKDNVATAREEINSGLILSDDNGDNVIIHENIPFGHKIALKNISKGSPIIKYGQRIGIAVKDIASGDLVHVHNLAGERGKSS
jgi:altronate dehydratase small subunit